MKRHAYIEVVMATDKSDQAQKMGQSPETTYYMTIANNLAATAAGSENKKKLPEIPGLKRKPEAP